MGLRTKLDQVKSLINKAKSRPFSFLLWKALDKAKKQINRYAYKTEGRKYSPEWAIKNFCSSRVSSLRVLLLDESRFRFFFDHKEVDGNLGLLIGMDASYADAVANKADRICRNVLPILGAKEKALGAEIDWHCDYRSGLRWDKKYAFDYDLLQPDRPSDVRVAWELNRLHFLADLGKAYRLSREERYVAKFKDIVSDWYAQNPVAYSVNWGCAMEAAIRSINLIWGIQFFLTAESLDDDFLGLCLAMLIQHGRFIYRNLEYSDIRGNHYIADLVGLIYLALFLRGYPEAENWLTFAQPRLYAEMWHQVYPDGVDHEGSIPYHRLVTEMFMSAVLLLGRNGIAPALSIMKRLEKMIEFIVSYVKPSGLCPIIGDSDDGRLFILGTQDINDHRYLISTGAVIYNRSDFKTSAGRFWEESLWLLGPSGFVKFSNLPYSETKGSCCYPHGGYFIMKHKSDYMIVDCGNVGTRSRGGHGHNDALSFELTLDGYDLIVDSGCASYTSNMKERIDAIGTGAHNTAKVDNSEMASIDIYRIPSANHTPIRVLEWATGTDGDRFSGEHRGFTRLAQPVSFRRTIDFSKKERRVIISDLFDGFGCHHIAVYFHFKQGYYLELHKDGIRIRPQGDAPTFWLRSGVSTGQWRLENDWVYVRYGVRRHAKVAIYQHMVRMPFNAIFEIGEIAGGKQ